MSKKLLIFVIAFTLFLAAVVVWWLTKSPEPAAVTTPVAVDTPAATSQETPAPAPPLTPQQVAVTNLKNAAMRFAEMYGSFSTDAPYANFEAVNNLVTANMRQVMDASRSDAPSEGFYAVTTKALLAEVESEADSTSTVTVSTQRLESFSREGQAQLRYQAIRLNLVRSGNIWLVDSAIWQ